MTKQLYKVQEPLSSSPCKLLSFLFNFKWLCSILYTKKFICRLSPKSYMYPIDPQIFVKDWEIQTWSSTYHLGVLVATTCKASTWPSSKHSKCKSASTNSYIRWKKKKKKNTIPAKLWKYLIFIFIFILPNALLCLSISKHWHQTALINLPNGYLRESKFRERKRENFDQRWRLRCKAVSLTAIFFN